MVAALSIFPRHSESSQRMKPVAVIFDFGGVFTESPVTCFARYEKQHGIPHRFISEVIKSDIHNGSFARFERAELDLDQFDAEFARETRAAGHEVSGKTLVSLLQLSFRPDMIDALDKINEGGFKTGCITNNMPKSTASEWARSDDEKALAQSVMGKFQHVIESSVAGVRKPEPRIYEMMCEALQVRPEESVFVDDLGINLKPARALGMRTVKVPFEHYRTAIDELAELTGLAL